MPKCIIIKWVDVANKDYNDRNAYNVTNWNYQTPTLPVNGLASDMEALIAKYVIPNQPVDPRYFTITPSNFATNVPDPDYPNHKQYVFTETPVPTTNEVKAVCIDEAEANAFALIIQQNKIIRNLTIWMGLMKKKLEGGTLTTAQQTAYSKIDAYALKAWQNYTINKAKKTAIDQGIEVDIDADWDTTTITED
jgi:hypothetical protein